MLKASMTRLRGGTAAGDGQGDLSGFGRTLSRAVPRSGAGPGSRVVSLAYSSARQGPAFLRVHTCLFCFQRDISRCFTFKHLSMRREVLSFNVAVMLSHLSTGNSQSSAGLVV